MRHCLMLAAVSLLVGLVATNGQYGKGEGASESQGSVGPPPASCESCWTSIEKKLRDYLQLKRPSMEPQGRNSDALPPPFRPRSRPRRTTRNYCNDTSRNSTCCRAIPFEIDIRDVGLDRWIIAPQRITDYDCTGDCPGQPSASERFTTERNGSFLIVTPTGCSATEMNALSILYRNDDGTIEVRRIPGVIVKKCGCERVLQLQGA